MFDWQHFQNFAFQRYPSLKEKVEKFYPSFFSPFSVPLPNADLERIRRFVQACFALRQLPEYQRRILAELPDFPKHDHNSVLMSYDFHLSEQGPRLIEINTNAGFFLGLNLLTEYQAERGKIQNAWPRAEDDLWQSFNEEHRAHTGHNLKGAQILIVDQDLDHQELFCEFLMYRDFFRSHGAEAEIADIRDLEFTTDAATIHGKKIDFIYNRHTDFYLNTPNSQKLRKLYFRKPQAFTLSPHPVEYALLASKKRLHEWQQASFWRDLGLEHSALRAAVNDCLIPSHEVSQRSPDEVWSERKKYFFKPLESFGSKAAYNGKSITKKVFDHILTHPYLMQEITPAPQIKVKTPEGESEFKYDLRVYVYRDQIQLIGARLYQGQITNFKTPYGGFAPVTVG